MAFPAPDEPVIGPDLCDVPPLQMVSVEQVQAMTDEEFRASMRFVYSDFDPESIEILKQDPRAHRELEPEGDELGDIDASVERDDVTAVSNFLKHHKDQKRAIVSKAIERGSIQLVRALISVARVNSRHRGETYLHKAATYGQLAIARILVEEKGASPGLKSPLPLLNYRTPAQVAAYYGHKEVFDYLILQGTQVPKEWQSFVSEMLKIAAKPQLLKLPLQPRLDRDIMLFLCNNNRNHAGSLLEVNLPDNKDGRTLLHVAAHDTNTIQLLLTCGANPFARDKSGRMPFAAWSSLEPAVDVNGALLAIFLAYYRKDAARMTIWGFPSGENSLSEGLGVDVFRDGKIRWLSMPENNAAHYTAAIVLASEAQGCNTKTTMTALQFLSRTFMQHESVQHQQPFREPSYNAFTFAKKMDDDFDDDSSEGQRSSDSDEDSFETNISDESHTHGDVPKSIDSSESESDSGARQPAQAGRSTARASGISLVMPYFLTEPKDPVLRSRLDAEEDARVPNETHWMSMPAHGSTIEEIVRARPVKEVLQARTLRRRDQRRRKVRGLNIHEPRTLDESYYIGLTNKQLIERNNDQVLSSYHKANRTSERLLMVSQLWLWRMGDIVITASGSRPDEQNDDASSDAARCPNLDQDPQWFLREEFKHNHLQRGDMKSSLQLVALVLSECINNIDQPNYAGLDESLFHAFENAVGTSYDKVKTYMKGNSIKDIQIKKETDFIHEISDVRDELAMIKTVIEEQEEVWERFYRNVKKDPEFKTWDTNSRLIAARPKYQIPKFKRRIQKIDEDAQRAEQWVLGQLELKKTHASLKESHNSTVLSTAVIGFTIITIIYTPLSFMTSFLAVPDGKLKWGRSSDSGNTWITVVEIISLAMTAIIVVGSLLYLKMKHTLNKRTTDSVVPMELNEEKGAPSSAYPDFTIMNIEEEKDSISSVGSAGACDEAADEAQRARPLFDGLRNRAHVAPVDLERFPSVHETFLSK